MPDQIKHPPDLLVASLVKQDFEPCVRLRFIQFRDLRGRGSRSIFKCNSTTQSLYASLQWHAFNFHFINFFYPISRGSDEVVKSPSLVRSNKTFGVEVEPPDRIKPSERRRQKLRHQRTSFRI